MVREGAKFGKNGDVNLEGYEKREELVKGGCVSLKERKSFWL